MNTHLFAADDGALYDTRVPDWSKSRPLRSIFKGQHPTILNAHEYKATLRAGAFAWPGGYPLFLCTSDGAALCFKCGRAELRPILHDMQHPTPHDQWRVVACDVNYEDAHLHCDHCGERIPSAYAEDNVETHNDAGGTTGAPLPGYAR